MAFFPPDNALAWAHFRVRGGWARASIFTFGALAILGMLMFTSVRVNPDVGGRTLSNWTVGLLALQLGCLLIYASGRVGNAIRQDVQTKMIESHRLMPTPAMHAIAGYIAGSVGQGLIFWLGILLIGAIAAGAGGISLDRWLLANAVLLAFCAFLWVVCAYAAFGVKLGVGFIFLPMIIPSMTDGGVLAIFPGLTVLLSPIIGRSIFNLSNTGMVLSPVYAMAVAAQLYFGVLFFLAAARKYRQADAIGMSTLLSLLLLAGWVGITLAGMREWEEIRPRGWGARATVTPVAQALAGMIAGMLLGTWSMAANANERVRWTRKAMLQDPANGRKPIPLALVVGVIIALLLSIPLSQLDTSVSPTVYLRSAAFIAIAMLGIYFLLSWAYANVAKVGLLAFFWIFFAWGVPIVIDLVRYGLADFGETEYIAGFSTCSPVGAMLAVWTGSVISTTPGLLAQLALAGIPAWLWWSDRRKRSIT